MKLNPIKSIVLTSLLALSFSCNTQSMETDSFLGKYCSKGNLITVASCAAVGYAGYKLYHYGKEYLENRIINETVDAIQTAFTPVRSLQNLPAQKREELFKKKARLINIRKRVMAQLDSQINTESFAFSKQHKSVIQKDLNLAKTAFKIIDATRASNPYENEYTQASTIDQIVENNIISSIILVTKPDNECSAKELNEKKIKEVRKAKIIAKLQGKAFNIAGKAFVRSAIGLAILLNGIN